MRPKTPSARISRSRPHAHVLAQKDRLKLVGRFLYQESDQTQGLKLNSRYVPLAQARDSSLQLNGGRGDQHHAFYLGLNYYLCGKG